MAALMLDSMRTLAGNIFAEALAEVRYLVGDPLCSRPLARWDAFVRYCDNGRIEIDNSAAGRALCAVAVGRKNYLFAGSDEGGERAATFYSPLGTAKLNGLNPEAYLRQVERIADHPVNRLAELLPQALAPAFCAQPLPGGSLIKPHVASESISRT